MEIKTKQIPTNYRVYISDTPCRDGTWQVEVYNLKGELIQVGWVEFNTSGPRAAIRWLRGETKSITERGYV